MIIVEWWMYLILTTFFGVVLGLFAVCNRNQEAFYEGFVGGGIVIVVDIIASFVIPTINTGGMIHITYP